MWARLLVGIVIASAALNGCSRDSEAAKREFVRSGDRLVAEKRYQEAVLAYRNALQRDPRYAEARVKLAETVHAAGRRTQCVQGDHPRRRSVARRCSGTAEGGRCPASASTVRGRAKSRGKSAGEEPIKRQRVDSARKRTRRPQPTGRRIARRRGGRSGRRRTGHFVCPPRIDASDAGREKGGEEAFLKAVEIDPHSIQVRLALARFYWAAGRPQDAEIQLKAAVAVDEKDISVNRSLAALYMYNGRAPEAEPYLKKIAEVTPGGQGRFGSRTITRGWAGCKRPKRFSWTFLSLAHQCSWAQSRSGGPCAVAGRQRQGHRIS